MPPPPQSPEKKQFNVLITGYGPFSYVTDNPSWACIAALHNTTLTTSESSHTIKITCVGPLRVVYDAILSLAPSIHSRPPTFPPFSDILHERTSLEPNVQPPDGGWDLTLHLGAGRNGRVTVETIGHKTGYAIPDADGKLPPIVDVGSKVEKGVSEAENFERKRIARENGAGSSLKQGDTLRGFGKGYEGFPEELKTEIDAEGLISFLRKKIKDQRILISTDAGHYLCDFICYGSLAESQRALFDSNIKPEEGVKRSKSLFMHVPYDLGDPFTLVELTTIMKQTVAWLCTGEGV
ncbi:hypothetical protein M422DRAFT_230565 [Sphaerobolus stellatus SS14]|uniref:Pyroglutamyl-peptidase I n=1 Tax=Sphaerobolus stellatus (strain SS14) TaxID=990650 RepID=A0A0C9UYL6_SPHS4|nr:hypothetical protein M422DRAFT_230565 [Sphaerobolus stellatus SS14]